MHNTPRSGMQIKTAFDRQLPKRMNKWNVLVSKYSIFLFLKGC